MGVSMGVNSINASMQVSITKQKTTKTTVQQKSQSTTKSLVDVVASRDSNYSFKVYTQATLNRLAAVVNMSAAELGINLETYDASPEATADRIAGFAISMFSVYQKQNPELSEEEALAKYEPYIKRAIDKGFNEALKILGSLNINDDQTMSGIQQTYDLIQEKLDNFFHGSSEQVVEGNA